MARICGWCKRELEPLGNPTLNVPDSGGKYNNTHTICPDCLAKMEEYLAAINSENQPEKPDAKAFNVSKNLKWAERSRSNHQLLNNIVMNILLSIHNNMGNIGEATDSITELRKRKETDIGEKIMARLDASIHEPSTMWGKMPLVYRATLRKKFRATMIQIMNHILASEGSPD